MELKYKRVLLKLSGEALAGEKGGTLYVVFLELGLLYPFLAISGCSGLSKLFNTAKIE